MAHSFTELHKPVHHDKAVIREGGIMGWGRNKEFGMNRYTLLYIKQRNKKGLLYNTGHYIQRLVITYNGKNLTKGM